VKTEPVVPTGERAVRPETSTETVEGTATDSVNADIAAAPAHSNVPPTTGTTTTTTTAATTTGTASSTGTA
jgi:hypothetical protein